MASLSQCHLDEVVKGKLHLPSKAIGCQELLRKPGIACNGWLRRKKPWKIPGSLFALLQSIAWERKYVIIHDGCMYFYNNESDTKPDKALSLFGYTRVMRAGELRAGREALWPFKVAYILDQNEKDRVHYFSASCEDEMKNWIRTIKRELYRANDVEYSEEDYATDDMDDLETPISTGNYFNEMKDLNKIRDAIKNYSDDSDLEDEYDYIEPDDQPPPTFKPTGMNKFSSAPNVSKVPAPPKKLVKSQNQAQISTSNPVIPSLPSTASAGYYPVTKQSAAKMLSVPPNKTIPLKPVASQSSATGKVPPATPIKQKRSDVNVMSSLAGNSESSQPKNSDVQTLPGSVANMRALFGGQTGSSANSSSASSKPLAESSAPKPLPPLPLSSRPSSNAPTAIVSPVRQPTPPKTSQVNRFARDLESEAMWNQGPGDGQRLLISLGQEGVYMVRQCAEGTSALTLLVIAGFQLRKYKVFKDRRGMYSLLTNFDPGFDSVHNLLNYYRTNCLPLRQTKLSSAYTELLNSR